MRSALNKLELSACIICWIVANLYSLSKLFESQTEILEYNPVSAKNLYELQRGWSFMPRLKDVSDYEWNSWKYLITTSWPYFIMMFVVSEVIRRKNLCKIQYWYITSSVMYILLHFGYKHLLLILAQPLLYATILFSGGGKISIWMSSILSLMFYNLDMFRNFSWQFLDHENMYDEEVYLLLFSLPWIELRCVSFCLDYIERNLKPTEPSQTMMDNLISLLSYALYAPMLFTGPVVLYEEFEKSYSEPCDKLASRFKRFLWDMFIFLSYTLIMDFTLHYVYFYAMRDNMQLIRMLPTLALCGGGLWMGIQFHTKYVIAYGTTTAFAKLDNIETPPTPRCIARIHIYSQMWRYFDVGLYRFLVKYIYKPVLKVLSRFPLPQITIKMSASLSTFIFICLWHGTIERIYIWSALNYLGITLEYISKAISETHRYKWFKKTILKTEAMETRFTAMLCMPLLAISAISNFYLFGGVRIGNLFFENLLHLNFFTLNSLLICLSLYCCCVVSMALQDVPSRTDVKKIIVKAE